jgi:hypothetical protein
VNGEKSTQGYYVTLQPWDSATASRLRSPQSISMWGNPSMSRMWEWYDPKAGGACGNLSSYLQGDTTARQHEGHWSGPNSPPDTTKKERHCIRPGVYEFSVADKTFVVDYLSVESASGGVLWVWNETAGIYEALEDGTAAPLQLAITGPTTVKPKVTCEWDAYPQGGSGGMTYSWRIGGQEVGTEELLYWYTGKTSFQITLIGQAGDGQADTAAVTVTVNQNAPTCLLKRG